VLNDKLSKGKHAPALAIARKKRSINEDLHLPMPDESLVVQSKSAEKDSIEDEDGIDAYDLVDVQNKAFKSFSKIFQKE
jgi:hypothetical protein